MKSLPYFHSLHRWLTTCLLACLLLAWGAEDAAAQFEIKEMNVGSLAHKYSEAGAEVTRQGGRHMMWPAVHRQQTIWYNQLWIGVKNFKDEQGRTWAAKVAHVTESETNQFFPETFDMISRFDVPEVHVDDFLTFAADPAFVTEVDESIAPAQKIHNVVHSSTGITMTRDVLGFSNEYHDNYHILEYTLTNTGNTDGDPEIELPDQTAEGVYLFFARRAIMPLGGANPIMFDYIGDGTDDSDIRALIQWQGNIPGGNGDIEDADPLGYPIFSDSNWEIATGDSVGRLSNPHFTGTMTLHADRSAGDASDDPNQPSTTGWFMPDQSYMVQTLSDLNEAVMLQQYQQMAKGHMVPHQADVVDQDDDFTTTDGDPRMGTSGGPEPMFAYGPYTLAPGESVRIVLAEGVNGLDRHEATVIGRRYKELKRSGLPDAQHAPIEFRGVSLGKNDWVYSGRDSLMETFQRARANFESGYAIPQAPLPPKEFRISSGGNRIRLEWEIYPGASPNGFEIYRARGDYHGHIDDNFKYELIHTAGPSERQFDDVTAARGQEYYYYIQAIGDVNTDPTGLTPTGVILKSNRYFAQTYIGAQLQRPPPEGEQTSSARVVPNPYNIGSAEHVRWAGEQDRLGFLDIPGRCTIRIYTVSGELIKTIVHDNETGDEFWDMTTEDRQLIVSGIYVAVIDNDVTGERVMKKFVVIR